MDVKRGLGALLSWLFLAWFAIVAGAAVWQWIANVGRDLLR